jgi:hypothetical protein
MAFYGLKMHQYMELIQMNKLIKLFVDKYISCNLSLLPITLQNAQQHQHTQTCKKKNHVVYRFHYPLPPTSKTTILKSL